MSDKHLSVAQGVIVEEHVRFTLVELSRSCGADVDQLAVLVNEGVLAPGGDDPRQWIFDGAALQRARRALRLMRDLDLNPSGVALVLELLGRIEELESQLRRRGGY